MKKRIVRMFTLGCVMMLFVAFMAVPAFATSGGNVSGAMRMPMYYVYLALPVSSLILCLRLIGGLIQDIKLLFGAKEENK